jgi:hypothetical protein
MSKRHIIEPTELKQLFGNRQILKKKANTEHNGSMQYLLSIALVLCIFYFNFLKN